MTTENKINKSKLIFEILIISSIILFGVYFIYEFNFNKNEKIYNENKEIFIKNNEIVINYNSTEFSNLSKNEKEKIEKMIGNKNRSKYGIKIIKEEKNNEN